MQRYYNVARDASGRAVSGAQVSVYQTGTSTLATIYSASDSALNPSASIANPMTTDSLGGFGFAAPNASYDIVVSGNGFPTYTINKINLFDAGTTSTSSTAAAGSTTQVQYNVGGVLGATATFTFAANQLTVGGSGTPGTFANMKYFSYDSVNSYVQDNVQNKSAGASASADVVASNDTSTDTTNFMSMGVNSSGWADATWTINGANDGYAYGPNNVAIGTSGAGKSLVFFVGGTLAANAVSTVTSTTWTIPAAVLLIATGGIRYNQGGSGAVNTTVGSKLGEWVSVKDFGAVGDGTTDDTTAFVNAIAASRNVYVPVPTSSYKITGVLTFGNNNQNLFGVGKASAITFTGAGICIDLNGKTYCSVRGLGITTATGTIGINGAFASHNANISGNYISGFSSSGIKLDACFYAEVHNNDIYLNTAGITLTDQAAGNHVHSNAIRQNLTGIIVNDTTGNIDGTCFSGNTIESSTASSVYGVQIRGADNVKFMGDRIEYSVGTAQISIDSGTGVTSNVQFIGVSTHGSIASVAVGDGTGSSSITGCSFIGGYYNNTFTISSDATNTLIQGSPGMLGSTLTDNGVGSCVLVDPSNSKYYFRNNASAANKYVFTVGGVATTIDTLANYLDLKNNVGSVCRVDVDGGVKALNGFVQAANYFYCSTASAGQTINGTIWQDSGQKALGSYHDGIKQIVPGVIFTSTATATVANTVSETSIVGTGVGTKTLPANFFVAGKTVRIRVKGTLGDTLTPTLQIKAKYGATVILDSTAVTLVTFSGTPQFAIDLDITCRSTGAAGTVQCGGTWDIQPTGVGTNTRYWLPQNLATIDTTASSALDVTATWGAASASNTISGTITSIEVLN